MNVVTLIQPRDPTELERLAERINADFEKSDAHARRAVELQQAENVRASNARAKILTADGKAMEARISAGLWLRQAKGKLKQESPAKSFEAWCAENVKRSARDIYACIAMVEARLTAPSPCIATANGIEKAVWERREDEDAVNEVLAKWQISIDMTRAKWANAKSKSRSELRTALAEGHVKQQDIWVKQIIRLCRNLDAAGRAKVKAALEEMDHA